MATKKRRKSRKKVSPFRRYLPYLIGVGFFVGLAALSYGMFRAWPTLARRWNAAKAEVLKTRQKRTPKKATPKSTQRPAPTVSSKRLEAEIKALRGENKELRAQLERTSEAIARKNAEIDELKLRILILQKMRHPAGEGE